jgi:hypothetical protein
MIQIQPDQAVIFTLTPNSQCMIARPDPCLTPVFFHFGLTPNKVLFKAEVIVDAVVDPFQGAAACITTLPRGTAVRRRDEDAPICAGSQAPAWEPYSRKLLLPEPKKGRKLELPGPHSQSGDWEQVKFNLKLDRVSTRLLDCRI